jgi:hypothetical protein
MSMGCLGCACLFGLLSAGLPRLALLFVWVFTGYVDRAFDGWIWPLLGLVFLPFTTLIYVLVWSPGGLVGWDWLWVGLALLFDLASYSSGGVGGRNRVRA